VKAKEYLGQIQKIDRLIENKQAEAEHWKTIATSCTAQIDGERVQSSGRKQKMADAVCRYMQVEEEISTAIDQLLDIRKEVIKTIEQLDTAEYDVLHKVYVQYKNFYAVAALMDKSYSWVTSVHGRALINLQRILDKDKKE